MRQHTPAVFFFLDSDTVPVRPGDELWRRPLPLQRGASPAGAADREGPETGDYFRAVEDFLTRDDHRHLRAAIPGGGSSAIRLPESVSIHLVKHGAFYHPARVVIDSGGRRLARVVNVAVSCQGKAVFPEEVAALKRLRDHRLGVIPEIYSAADDIGAHRMAMFIAEWMEGFSEWHLSAGDDDMACRQVMLWDADRGHCPLPQGQKALLFRTSAALLTGYYDLTTSGHIGRWHHGAGDFIIRPEGQTGLAVRLITVRRYGPLMPDLETHPEDMIDALLVFLLDLTLKNRLDRQDGIGDLVLAEPAAVGWTVAGFFDALSHHGHLGHFADDFPEAFLGYLGAMGEGNIGDLVSSLIERWPAGSEERLLYERHGDAHIATLMAAIKDMDRNGAGNTTR